MSALDAALSAFYPVLVIMGVLILLRFFPLLANVAPTTRPLICSMLVVVMSVMWEQIMFGYGRFSGLYLTIANAPLLVGIGKIGYMVGFSYLLYSFWLLSPTKPRLWTSLSFAFAAWLVITATLML